MVFTFEQPTVDLQNYYHYENGFTPDEIEKLLTDIESLPLMDAGTGNENEKNEIRKSVVKWLPFDTFQPLYKKLMGLITEANTNLFHFDILNTLERIQYTEYHAPNGHYDFHQDIGPGSMSLRKLSITVQLTDPGEYTGGELQYFKGGKNMITVSKTKGSVFIFPSYMIHRVLPVTKGVRKSLVLWVGGSHFR